MSEAPAPLWRRLCAAGYDGLLLIAIWFAALLIDVIVRDALGAPRSALALQLYLFGMGLLFFGWFWVHGGQTLGMRAWKLRVQRTDGYALNWRSAAVRYAAMLVCWTTVLLPLFARLPHLRDYPNTGPVALACALAAASGFAAFVIDRRRRAPHDWLSGSVVVQLRPAAATVAAEAARTPASSP